MDVSTGGCIERVVTGGSWLQARYAVPDLELSAECKELLRKILVVDPRSRITIAQIKEHPWYLFNLPNELKVQGRRPVHLTQGRTVTQYHYDVTPSCCLLTAIASGALVCYQLVAVP